MNKKQREKLSEIQGTIEEIQIEEQEKYDNAPENLMYSEKYERIQEIADELQEAISIIETIAME